MYQSLHCPTCDGEHWVYLCGACGLVHDGEMCGSWEQRSNAWLGMIKGTLGDVGVPVFMTLTFSGRYPGPQRGRKAVKGFLESVKADYVSAFFTEERGAENDRLHYHGVMLMRPDAGLSKLVGLKTAWAHGFSRMEIVEDLDGSLTYVLKYTIKEAGEASWFEFSKGSYSWL